MKGFTRTLEVAAPPARVFQVLTDIDNAPKWMPAIQKTEWVTGKSVAFGSAWRETRLAGKRTMVAVIHVVGFEPDRKLDLRVEAGMFEMDIGFRLSAAGKGTRVDYSCSGRGKGLMALMTGSIMKMVEKQDDDLLRRFKAYAEAE
jgi:carbon monoxide dehydrogenase subunit G